MRAARHRYATCELGRLFAEFLERGRQIYRGQAPAALGEPVVITGAALGLPGTERIFDDANVGRILHGEQFIDVIPTRFRHAMLDKHITRLVKSDEGGATFEVDRQRRRRDQARRRAAAPSTSAASSAFPPSACRRSTSRRASPSGPGSTRCATPASRW